MNVEREHFNMDLIQFLTTQFLYLEMPFNGYVKCDIFLSHDAIKYQNVKARTHEMPFIPLFIYYFHLFIAKQKYYTGEWVRYDTFVCAHDLLQKYGIKYITGRKYRKTIMGWEVYITTRCIMAM